MPSTRFSGVLRAAHAACGLFGAAGAMLAGVGVWSLYDGAALHGSLLIAAGVAAAAAGLAVGAGVHLLLRMASDAYRMQDALLDMLDVQRRQQELLRAVADNSSLSDLAKKIVFREKDVEFLRDSIHGAIIREDWTAADHLIGALEDQFGHEAEGAGLRAEVVRAQAATQDERVSAACQRVETLCAAQKWEIAQRDAQRLRMLFPANARIDALHGHIEQRRRDFKHTLLKQYDAAIRGHDMDSAHRLLIELDRYLSPNEAAALKDSARGVFKARLMQMGVQFSLAVSERQYEKALQLGTALEREFPNSRYAQEIRALAPVLRKRLEGDHAAHSVRTA